MNSELVKLLHDCTQKEYQITFTSGFSGMLTVGYQNEFDDSTYNHVHIGVPGEDLKLLEKQLRNFLAGLLEK